MKIKEILRKYFRHPLHWVAGFVSSACLIYPIYSIGIAASVLTFAAFFIYEKWEEGDIGDQGWKDWWEFVMAFFIVIIILLIKELV